MGNTKQALTDHWAGIITTCAPANEQGYCRCTVRGVFEPERVAEFEATELIAASTIVQISGSQSEEIPLQYSILAKPESAMAHIYGLLEKFDLDPCFPPIRHSKI